MAINYRTFEVRMVKFQDHYAFYFLSKDKDGVYYFTSSQPISCIVSDVKASVKLLKELQEALTKSVIDYKSIVNQIAQ